MKIRPDLGKAWLLLTTSLAIHVFDEAYNDFLDIYNPIANISGILPVYTYPQWISGLIFGIVILYGMTIFAYEKKAWFCYFSFLYGGIMILNGLAHFLVSIYFKELIAGSYSSPLLIISSIYIIWSAVYTLNQQKPS